MFSEDQYSRIIQQRVSDMFIVATSPQRTFLTGPSNGIVASEFVCRVPAPLTTAQCRAKYQLEIEAIIGRRITGEEDFKATWQSLYPTAYSRELFVLEPLREDRRGNPLPQELIFVCPDELPVNDDGSVGDGKPDDEPFTCSQCAEMYNNPCKFYVTAGTRTSLTITAVTIFGAVSVSRNDNFTAFIESPSFEDASNLGSLPEAEFVLGPVFRQAFQIDASGQPFGERLVSTAECLFGFYPRCQLLWYCLFLPG